MDEQILSKKERREQRHQEKLQRKEKTETRARNKKIVLLSVLILATVVMIWLIATASKGTLIKDISPDPAIGPSDAKVVIKEYADFECPACAATYPVLNDILKQYEGKVRFEYNDFPLPQHSNAVAAAVAGQCAFDQNKFFEMHDMLFDKQKEWEVLAAQQAKDTFSQYAQTLGLDAAAFASCTAGKSASDRVNEDLNEGNSANVNSTPTFFVNGERISTTPFSTNLKAAIDAALAKAQ